MPDVAARDELDVLAALRAEHGPVFVRRPGEIWVGDPDTAKEVLSNLSGRYQETSDFFHTRFGVFGSRDAQVDIGGAARTLLRSHAGGVAAAADRIPPVSAWPDTGNRLVYAHFRDALLRPSAPPILQRLLDDVVRHAVLAGAREERSRAARAVLRTRVTRALAKEIRSRGPADEPDDVIGILARHLPADPSRRQLAELTEVFLSCLFAVAGSIGFLLAWSVYLLGTEQADAAAPHHVVREALRLWPVAWLFGRTPVVPHTIAGVPVTPRDEVLVCGYLVQRDPRCWDEPDEFRPSRWVDAEPAQRNAFIPFGWGPHACTGAALAMDVVEEVLTGLTTRYRIDVEARGDRPQLAAALAPPPFILRLSEPSHERR